MSKTDRDPFEPGDIAEAIALLTVLPVAPETHRGGAAAWAWPIAGGLVAIASGLTGLIALGFGLSPALAAGLVLLTQMVLTGGLHEDGLADCADGFWGGRDRDRRLEIMKDSRVGTFGVLALILATGLRWAALSALFSVGWVMGPLIIAAMLSRSAMAGVMHILPTARDNGLSVGTGAPDQRAVLAGAIIALILSLLLTGFGALPALFIAAIAASGVALTAWGRIGGQTGDVLGASQVVTEIAVLAFLVTFAT